MAAPKASKLPSMLYGTAWKKDRTRALVKQAILTGFRGVDTAAQPKHYREEAVGQGISDALQESGLFREQIYSIADQIATSIASSLCHFHFPNLTPTSPNPQPYIDCLVLHSPLPTQKETETAWRAMEQFVPLSVHSLGISNIYNLTSLRHLYDFATIKPTIVQNRFHPATNFDAEIRAFCADKGMVYQSFWTLSANPELLRSNVVVDFAGQVGVGVPVALYGLVLGLGEVCILNGTTDGRHMVEDLEGVEKIKEWRSLNEGLWGMAMDGFQGLLTGGARLRR